MIIIIKIQIFPSNVPYQKIDHHINIIKEKINNILHMIKEIKY